MSVTTANVLSHLRGYPADLRWADFRTVQNSPHPPFQAQTQSRFNASYRTTNAGGVYKLSQVSVTVTKGGSAMWAVAGASRTAALLKHEQGHFDITGLIARDLCRDLLSIEYDEMVLNCARDAGNTRQSQQRYATSVLLAAATKAQQDAADLFKQLAGERTPDGGHSDGQYDSETDHGMIASAQTKWNDILQYARLNDTSLRVTMMIWGGG